MTRHLTLTAARLAAAALVALPAYAAADSGDWFQTLDNKPLAELWINPGFYSYHFKRDRDLNDSNPGLGGEYRFSTVASVTAGRFYNSDREYSNYAGVYYQPFAVGPVRLGAVLGAFDGYPRARNGGWFPAVIPTMSFEYKRVGANIAIIPGYKDRLYGAVSVQLKLKVFD
ncbi:hypothetical protein [Pseudoduganella namucuonensis]|uniref:Sn-glycerol-3-phosphate transporter n=1 Tax=Pseudoduganella namucuonensis TaxID=1035707 RepID=A0A1I7LTE8_9BURK|nr:hypothetical protein [Pseudoduganella namucuonensis]SFV12986.1 hypothetical protein SAMN05216552_103751 [Pseudoduganella namucuonensis]